MERGVGGLRRRRRRGGGVLSGWFSTDDPGLVPCSWTQNRRLGACSVHFPTSQRTRASRDGIGRTCIYIKAAFHSWCMDGRVTLEASEIAAIGSRQQRRSIFFFDFWFLARTIEICTYIYHCIFVHLPIPFQTEPVRPVRRRHSCHPMPINCESSGTLQQRRPAWGKNRSIKLEWPLLSNPLVRVVPDLRWLNPFVSYVN